MQSRKSQARKHAITARDFLEAADGSFEEEDLLQVSEKLWGAAAHAVESVCIHRRWRHGNYAHLRNAAERLTEETGDSAIMAIFLLAYSHHLNFYTDAMEAEEVGPARRIVRELVDKLVVFADVENGNTDN